MKQICESVSGVKLQSFLCLLRAYSDSLTERGKCGLHTCSHLNMYSTQAVGWVDFPFIANLDVQDDDQLFANM